jgi:hypothetical protein
MNVDSSVIRKKCLCGKYKRYERYDRYLTTHWISLFPSLNQNRPKIMPLSMFLVCTLYARGSSYSSLGFFSLKVQFYSIPQMSNSLWDLGLCLRRVWRWLSSGVLRRVTSWKPTNISDVLTASVVVRLSSWWWRQQAPLKRRYTSTRLHDSVLQQWPATGVPFHGVRCAVNCY